MDLEEVKSGTELIKRPGYTLNELKEFIESTVLVDKNKLKESVDLEEIYNEFLKILEKDKPLQFGKRSAVCISACMFYFINPSIKNHFMRFGLITQAFQFHLNDSDANLNLKMIKFTECLYNKLKIETMHVLNIIELCPIIGVCGEVGSVVAIGLTWILIDEITSTRKEGHCFNKFSDLNRKLDDLDVEYILEPDSLPSLFVLTSAIAFILAVTIYDSREIDFFKKYEYNDIFKYTEDDLKQLLKWTKSLSDRLVISLNRNKYWELRLKIKTLMNCSLLNPLGNLIQTLN